MSKRKKILLGIVAGVVVVLIAGGVVFWPSISTFVTNLFVREQADPTPGDPVVGNPVISQSQQLYNKAAEAATKDGPAAGQKVLDEELAKTEDKAKKATIYTQKSTLASSPAGGSNMKTALEYAYDAEEENPSYATAIMIAEMEYYTGDKSKALTYYKLYLERLTEEQSDLNPGDKEAVEKRIQELESSL